MNGGGGGEGWGEEVGGRLGRGGGGRGMEEEECLEGKGIKLFFFLSQFH